MTINNGTKKIKAPPKEIPRAHYVGSSVGRIFLRIRFCFVRARDLMLLWCQLLFTRLFFASLLLEKSFSWCPSLLSILSESCCIWNIFHSRSAFLLIFFMFIFFMSYFQFALVWSTFYYICMCMINFSIELIISCICIFMLA